MWRKACQQFKHHHAVRLAKSPLGIAPAGSSVSSGEYPGSSRDKFPERSWDMEAKARWGLRTEAGMGPLALGTPPCRAAAIEPGGRRREQWGKLWQSPGRPQQRQQTYGTCFGGAIHAAACPPGHRCGHTPRGQGTSRPAPGCRCMPSSHTGPQKAGDPPEGGSGQRPRCSSVAGIDPTRPARREAHSMALAEGGTAEM